MKHFLILLLSIVGANAQIIALTNSRPNWPYAGMTNDPMVPACAVVFLSTNEVTHWPQVTDMDTDPSADHGTNWVMFGGVYFHHSHDDTNADTKFIETTVHARRMLMLQFEGRNLELELTNWMQAHYQVDYRRVRTNAWAHFPDTSFALPDGRRIMLSGADIAGQYEYQTNWFEATATNRIELFVTWRTNISAEAIIGHY